jgi:hypothetical protein
MRAIALDRDPQAHDLIAALFSRSHAPIGRVVLVEERDPGDPEDEPRTWATAFEQVTANATCTVIDSPETWANTYAEQASFARAGSGHGASVKLILADTHAAGEVEGVARLRRVGDAVVVLDARSWLGSYASAAGCRAARSGFRGISPPIPHPANA